MSPPLSENSLSEVKNKGGPYDMFQSPTRTWVRRRKNAPILFVWGGELESEEKSYRGIHFLHGGCMNSSVWFLYYFVTISC